MAGISSHAVAALGLSHNVNGGVYRNGVPYDILKKIELVEKYEELCDRNEDESEPSWAELGRVAKVSDKWAKKVIMELQSEEGLIDPYYQKPLRHRGSGALTLDSDDAVCLIALYRENPSRTLRSYQTELFRCTGTLVSQSTISRVLLYGFPHSATLRKPNLVPIDKFRPDNVERAIEYLRLIMQLDHRRIKFTDEKSPPSITTDSDFRNVYNIVGFCGVDQSTDPFFFCLNQDTNDSVDFSIAVEKAIVSGFLKPYDVVVGQLSSWSGAPPTPSP